MNDDKPLDPEQDQLLRRIQAADPTRSTPTAAPWITDLVEATMSTTPVQHRTRIRRWAPALAAAAVLAAIGAGAYTALSGPETPGDTPGPTVMTTLAMPGSGGGPSMGSCIRFDVKYLRDMPVAFAGTATQVGDDSVTLDVDHWYRGGVADVVRLAHYNPATVSLDGFEFVRGDRYLITATGGTVNFCGYSGPWSQNLADAFQEAFGS